VSDQNRQWRVARYPQADEAISNEHFAWGSEAVPVPGDGEFLVRTAFLAPGPAQRGYLDPDKGGLFDTPVPIGDVMRGRGIGEIVASRHPDYAAGEVFLGSLGWQDYSLQKPLGADFVFSTRKITKPRQPLSLHLGILGQAGGTGYFGMLEAAEIRAGDNVLVSAAAGGVGSVAGQIARIKGANSVVGIAGSDEKCAWLCKELGFSAAINYKTANLDEQLQQLFPQGIDVFFDNVGGTVLNTALAHIAMHGRIAVCGLIATQYASTPQPGPENYRYLVFKRARMQGFVFFDYWERYAEAEQALATWLDSGQLRNTEHVIAGLERMPAALAALFSGENRGISICSI